MKTIRVVFQLSTGDKSTQPMSKHIHARRKSQAFYLRQNQISDYLGRIAEAFEIAAKRELALQFVIANANKKPVWTRWNKRYPTMDNISKAVREDGCYAGFVPASANRGVIDIDAGPMHVIGDHKEPIASIESLSGFGVHNHYYADRVIKNRNIKPGQLTEPGMEEIACDIIYDNKYVLLSPQGIHQFPQVIDCDNPEDYIFPYELIPQPTRYIPPPPNAPEYIRPIKGVDTPMKGRHIDMTRVMPRNRNNSLFHVLCRGGEVGRLELKAGRIKSVDDLIDLAVKEAAKLPIPLPAKEVIKTARNAWEYLPLDGKGGVGRDYYTHDPKSQSRRAHIKKAKHNEKIKPKVKLAFDMRAQGASVRVIADKIGVSTRTIERWCKPLLSR